MKRSLQLIALLPALATMTSLAVAQTQAEMTQQAHDDAQASDMKLNDVYQRLTAAVEKDLERKQKLLASQRAWLKFRDAQCEQEGDIARGGSMQPQLKSICFKQMTDHRASTFEWLLNVERGTPATRPSR